MAKITKKQETFLIYLMETSTIVEACSKAGIANGTGHKWLNDPTFKKEYNRLRRETLEMATNKLQQSAIQAVEILAAVMNDEETPATSRVHASKVILDNAFKSYSIFELEQRMGELEALLSEQGQGRK